MITRVVTNQGAGFRLANGSFVKQARVTVELLNGKSEAKPIWDAASGSLINTVVEEYVTNDLGEITRNNVVGMSLWPNSRGATHSYYRMRLHVSKTKIETIKLYIPEGDSTPLALTSALAIPVTLQPAEMSALQQHLASHPQNLRYSISSTPPDPTQFDLWIKPL